MYFIHPLLPFIYFTHLFNKIFILLLFFYYFLQIPLTHCLFLSHKPTSTTINPSNQTSSTHPAILTHILKTPFNPKESQINPNTRNPIQPKRKPNKSHSTRNPLIKQPEIKESNQIGGKISDRWRRQSVVVAVRDWFAILIKWRKRKRVRDN